MQMLMQSVADLAPFNDALCIDPAFSKGWRISIYVLTFEISITSSNNSIATKAAILQRLVA